MHPLRQLVISAVVLAVLAAVAVGFALHPAGDEGHFHFLRTIPGAVLAAILIFLLATVPALVEYVWIMRRANESEALVAAIRRIAAGEYKANVPVSGSEFEEFARGMDELRQIIVRQKASFEEQQQLLREIVESLREGLIALDGRRKIVFANSVALQVLNISGEAVGRSFVELVRQHTFVDALERAIKGEVSTDRATLTAGGRERRVECRMFPVGAPNEIAVVALFIDVTQIEKLETTRRDFLSDFSHEVRTPLAGLRSAVDTLDAGGLQPEEDLQLRKIVTRQVGRLEHLVRDLSELNRIESGDLVLVPEAIDLRQLLSDLASEYAEQAAARGCAIEVSGEARAWADPHRAQQIFSNLVENALKHSGATRIVIDAGESGSEAIVRISDNGSGIARGDQEKVFRRFYRVDKSRSRTGGSGLGLAITKHLVLQHGGSIRLESTEGSGAVFEVRLPKKQSPAATATSSERSDATVSPLECDE